MFEGLKRFVRRMENRIEKALEPDPIDVPRPQRANPDPPKDNWFARTEKRSLTTAPLGRALSSADSAHCVEKLLPHLEHSILGN